MSLLPDAVLPLVVCSDLYLQQQQQRTAASNRTSQDPAAASAGAVPPGSQQQQQQQAAGAASAGGFGGSAVGAAFGGGAGSAPLAQQAEALRQQQQRVFDARGIRASTSLCNVAVMSQQLSEANVAADAGAGMNAAEVNHMVELQHAYLKLVVQQLQGSEILTGVVSMVTQGQGPQQRNGIACQVVATENN
jgi:hypothetical protein